MPDEVLGSVLSVLNIVLVLFGFFLVFGKPNPDQNLEKFDAVTLLDQILLEQEMRLGQEGFDVRPVRQGDPP